MTEELAKRASELLKQKSKLFDDLNVLNNSNEFYFIVLNTPIKKINPEFAAPLSISNNKTIKEKFKNILINEIKKEIERIDVELNELKCE